MLNNILRKIDMSRRCIITGKGVQSGNNVSHAKNRTRRRFLPNLQEASFYSDSLKKMVKFRVSAHGMRTIEHNGGIDSYVMSIAPTKLDPSLRKIRKQVEALQTVAA